MKFLLFFLRALESVEKALLAFLLFVLVFLSFLQVVLRLAFSTGFLWADQFLRHLVLWIGFLGAGVAVQNEGHFAIDFVPGRLPPGVRRIVRIMIDGLSLAVLYFLCGAAGRFWKDEVAMGDILFSIGALEIPAHWLNAILPVGFILLGVHYALRVLLEVFGVSEKTRNPLEAWPR